MAIKEPGTVLGMARLVALKQRNDRENIEFQNGGNNDFPPTDDSGSDNGGRRERPRFNKYALIPFGASLLTAVTIIAHEILSMPVVK